MMTRTLLFLLLLLVATGCSEERQMSAPSDSVEKSLVSKADLKAMLLDTPKSTPAPPPASVFSGPVAGPLRANAPLNEEILKGTFPGYKLEKEEALGNYHLSKKRKLVATFHVDKDGKLQAVTLYRSGITLGGTPVAVGASFAKVAKAFSLKECSLAAEESTTIECKDEHFLFTFRVAEEARSYLEKKAPGEIYLALSLKEAKKLIGKRRLSEAHWERG